MSDAPPDPLSGPADDQELVDSSDPAAPTFASKPLLRLGYDRAAVDEFVTKVVLAVHNERQTTVTADEVAGTRFPSRRLGRGYDMRDVDDYLGAAEALLRMRATARGERAGPGAGAGGSEHHSAHPRTRWIYAVALLLVLLIVGFTLTQI